MNDVPAIPRRVCQGLAIGFLVSLFSACGGQCPSIGEDTDVVVIDISGCRPDKMETYGFERTTSPTLSRLAAERSSVVFENHHAAGTWAKPSTASLFTGLLVSQHGVVRDSDAAGTQDHTGLVLDEAHQTLAELLRDDHGFRTFGIVSTASLAPELGFARGFDDYFASRDLADDSSRAAKAFELLTTNRTKGQPVFGYLQFAACSDPYPTADRDPAYLRAHHILYGENRRRMLGIDFHDPDFQHTLHSGRVELSEPDAAFLDLIYEAKLYRFDRHVLGPLFDGLREVGVFDSALIMVTAGHGQELYEHHGYGNGHTPWRELAEVPLIVKFPRLRRPPDLPPRVRELTNTVDLFPSIVCAIGAETPLELPGRQIFLGEHQDWALTETATSLRLVTSKFSFRRDADTKGLYDREQDSGEQTDLAAERVAMVTELEGRLAALSSTYPPPLALHTAADRERGREALRLLRSLGSTRTGKGPNR